jgi:uncharacterized phage protein (TIGR01671 family)
MREIKFRAWNKTEKWMDEEFCIHADGHIYQDARNRWDISDQAIESAYDDLIVMEFTGMYDSYIDGKEVFESDIIKNCDTHELQIVYWNEKAAAWYCKYHNSDRIVSLADSLGNLNKKIGNIYENPELLK